MKLGRYATSMFTALTFSILLIAVFPAVGGSAVSLCFIIAMLDGSYDNETKIKELEELPY